MSILEGYHEECGVFGIFNHTEPANIAYLGLHGLQHRGQESAGIAAADGKNIIIHRGMGYVADVFSEHELTRLPGKHAIGHVRYSTQGESHLKNAQPVVVSCWRGPLALSHNGNLVNAIELRKILEHKGSIFQTTNDSEVILHLIAKTPAPQLKDALISAVREIAGAYSFLILTPDSIIAIRDPGGFRPLILADLNGSPVLASETCALDIIGATYVRDVEPGEMLTITDQGIHSEFPLAPEKHSFCIFELIYFSRPDSQIFGQSVYEVRKKLGRELAREHSVEADVVIPVPDSGIVAAMGVAEAYQLPFEMGLIRNHYVGRTFIEPKQSIRDFGVKIKLNPVRAVIEGKRVVVVDDSIVRGTTSRKLVRIIRNAGAREVHVRISSPPTIGSCIYGIDTPNEEELIGAQKSVEEIREYIGADSLGYLSIEGLIKATGNNSRNYCLACFNREYPTKKFSGKRIQLSLFESNS